MNMYYWNGNILQPVNLKRMHFFFYVMISSGLLARNMLIFTMEEPDWNDVCEFIPHRLVSWLRNFNSRFFYTGSDLMP
jgi:hypothetical protein